MSFVIGAIYKGVNLCMAADTKLTSRSGFMKYDDVHKIANLNSTTAIGVAGNYHFAQTVVADLYCKGMSQREYLDTLRKVAARQHTMFNEQYSRKFDFQAQFVLVGQQLMRPYLSLSSYRDGTLMNCYDPYKAGDFRYFFANPVDVDKDTCKAICDKTLGTDDGLDAKAKLESVVKQISELSTYVNDKVDIWKVNVMGR